VDFQSTIEEPDCTIATPALIIGRMICSDGTVVGSVACNDFAILSDVGFGRARLLAYDEGGIQRLELAERAVSTASAP
jgi:hypothetical protein